MLWCIHECIIFRGILSTIIAHNIYIYDDIRIELHTHIYIYIYVSWKNIKYYPRTNKYIYIYFKYTKDISWIYIYDIDIDINTYPTLNLTHMYIYIYTYFPYALIRLFQHTSQVYSGQGFPRHLGRGFELRESKAVGCATARAWDGLGALGKLWKAFEIHGKW